VAIIDGRRPIIVAEVPNATAGFGQLTTTLDHHHAVRMGIPR
jgi:hypothetical protein